MSGNFTFKRFLLVKRNGVINTKRNILISQGFTDTITVSVHYTECVLMENMPRIWYFMRSDNFINRTEVLVVLLCCCVPGITILIQIPEFHIKDSCLDGIQPGIHSYDIMI